MPFHLLMVRKSTISLKTFPYLMKLNIYTLITVFILSVVIPLMVSLLVVVQEVVVSVM